MPLVEIKFFEGELSEAQTQEVIEKVTDVLVSFSGEGLREATWVVVQEVKSGHWGLAVRRWASTTSEPSKKRVIRIPNARGAA